MSDIFSMVQDWGFPTWLIIIFTLVYALYTFVRAYSYFQYGVHNTLLGIGAPAIRLYHIIWFVIDLPSIVMGRFYYVLKWIFGFSVYTFKEDANNKEG